MYGKQPPQTPIFLYLFRKMLYSWGTEISTLNLEFKWSFEHRSLFVLKSKGKTLHSNRDLAQGTEKRQIFFLKIIKYQINLLEYNKHFKLGTQTNSLWEFFVWCDPSAVEFVEKKSSVALRLPLFRIVEKDLWNGRWL